MGAKLPRTDDKPCVVFDLSGRGHIFVGGKDRAELLHGLLTNDVKGLRPGRGCHAALLTPKGKMRAEMTVLCLQDALLVDCEPELAGTLPDVIRSYVFFQEVTAEDRTPDFAVLHVLGPDAPEVLARAGATTLPSAAHEHLEGELAGRRVRIVAEPRTGRTGFDVRLGAADRDDVLAALSAAGAEPAALDAFEAARIDGGVPRWGRELDESVLPNEAFLERTAISYNKGCYIGQEIVARIKTYGHVNRLLARLVLETGAGVAPGAEVRSGEAKVGSVTSAAHVSRLDRVVALGYVKRELAAPGTELTVLTPDGPRAARVEARADDAIPSATTTGS